MLILLTHRLAHLSVCLCVGLVCLSVWKVYCGKMADWIRIPLGMVTGVDRGMGVLDRDGDRRRGRGSFGGEFGASHCNQLWLRCIVVRERCALPKWLLGGLVWHSCSVTWHYWWQVFTGPANSARAWKGTQLISPTDLISLSVNWLLTKGCSFYAVVMLNFLYR